MFKRMLILMLFILLPINVGFVENSSVESLDGFSTELTFHGEHYESSKLMMSEFNTTTIYDAIPIYSPENIVESIIMLPPIRAVIYSSVYNYKKSGLALINNSYFVNSTDIMLVYSNNGNIYNPDYYNKGGGHSPFHLHYMILNSKVNRQVLQNYTSGFV